MTALQGPSRATRLWFWAGVAVLIAGNAWLARIHPSPTPEWPVAFDLLLLLPFAYWWVHRKRGRAALVGAAALFGTGILVGGWIVPTGSQVWWPWLQQLRYVGLFAVLLVQAGLLSVLVREVVRAQQGQNLELALDDAISRRLGRTGIASVLRLEARMWLYALVRRPVRHAFAGDAHFHVHLQQGNASNQGAFLLLIAVEVPVMHVIVHLFNPLAAIIVSALSVYGFIFLWAEYRATRLRPVSATATCLQIRYGVAGDVAVPWACIASVTRHSGLARRATGRMRFIGMGAANVRIGLRRGTRLPGLLGEREVDEVLLGIDEPERFIACLHARISPE